MKGRKPKVRFFNPGLTYKKHKTDFDRAFKRVMKNGDLILRKDVEDFETWLAGYIGTQYAVALNSCTDALHLALRYLKIGPGDEVIVPARTFVATVQVIVQVGATPVLVDINENYEQKITEKTKAIIPVHIEGQVAEGMGEVLGLARDRGITVIEDAAQALGAVYEGKKLGSYGLAGCFSFYPAKILGAFGDAGALVTNDENLYNWVKGARNHFKEDARDWGVNSRTDNLQAALLNVRVPKIEDMLARRKEIAEKYAEGLKDIPGLTLPIHSEGRAWQDYIVRTERRDELFLFLKDRNCETLKNNYPFPIPKTPEAQKYEDETLRLPCNENLKDREIQHVIEVIKKFFA